MAVNNIEKDGEAQAMSRIDKALEVFRSSVAGRGSEEGGDLVAERCIVRVLHDCHPGEAEVSSVKQ